VRPYPQLSHGRPVREAEVPASCSWSRFERGCGRGRTAVRPYPLLSHGRPVREAEVWLLVHGRPVREAEVPAAWSGSHLARSYMILAYLIARGHKYAVYAICARSLFFS
jgi:hypothetical protein